MTGTERQENDMTDDQTTTAPAEEITDATQAAPADVETGREAEETEQGGKGNREAARYRKQLRETETERDQLRERLDTMHRAEVERLAGAVLSKPSGLWAAGVQVADLLAEDGTVDRSKVEAAAKQAAAELGLARPSRNYVPREGANPIVSSRPSMVDTVMGRDQ